MRVRKRKRIDRRLKDCKRNRMRNERRKVNKRIKAKISIIVLYDRFNQKIKNGKYS